MSKHSIPKMLSAIMAVVIGNSAIPLEPIAYAVASTENAELSSSVVAAEEESGSLKNGDVNKDGTIDENDVSAIASTTIVKSPQADVNADGKLDQTDADMIASLISGEIGYFPVGTYYSADTTYVTRGEWIHSLVTGFSMSASEDSEIKEYYTDLADYEYGAEITLAANFGVFDVLGTEFHPDAYVTRDFAAHTMNFCLGYPNDATITYKDVDAVYYDGDAQIALNMGWFKAENNEFRPSMYVTTAESALAYADMEEAALATIIDENHVNTIEYKDGVIQITDASKIELAYSDYYGGEELSVYGSKNGLEDGQIVVFSIDGIEMIRKIVNTTGIGDDVQCYLVEAVDEEVIKDCDVEGYATVDYDSIEVLADGLSVDISEEGTVEQKYNAGLGVKASSSGNLDLKYTKISLEGKIPMGNSEMTIKGSIKNIKIPYAIDINGLSINRFYVGFNADAEISAEYSLFELCEPKEKELIRVPISGSTALGVNLVVSALVSVSGEISLEYSFQYESGIEYTKSGGWRTIRNFTGRNLKLKAKVEEKLGIKAALALTIAGKDVGQLYLQVGEKGSITAAVQTDNPHLDCTFQAYLFGEFGAKIQLTSKIKFTASYEFWNKNNSPIRIKLQIKNGEIINETRNEVPVNSNGDGSCGGGASGGYVSGYGYGSGYGGGHGYGWLSKFYGATIAFKELEPALVITEDRMLTSDLDVETDLILRAKLDLNGHKLTAQRNLYVGDWYDGEEGNWGNPGELILNKGTAEIKGNLSSIHDSNIVMKNKDDKIVVDGNVSLEGNSTFTAGTLEIKGNVSGNAIESSDMHLIILSGTGNQDISGGGIRANVLDINNSDSRTITVDSNLSAESSTTIDGTSLHLICNQSRNDESYVNLNKLNGDKLLIDGNVTLGTLDYRGKEITINGDLLDSGSITLSKASMTINGNATTGGDFTPNASTISVTGNYHHCGFLYMKNRNDKLNVGGELHLEGTGDSIQDGVIDVKGDVRFTHVIHTFIFERYNNLGGNNKVILSGEDDVTIYMDGGNFNDIEFLNSDKRSLYTDSSLPANSINCGDKPLNIITRNGSLSLGTITCSDFNVNGDCSIGGEYIKFNCKTITFEGDVNVTEGVFSLDLNGIPTVVKGTLTHRTDANGSIYLNGAKLTVDNYILEWGNLDLSKGIIEVNGDFTVKDGKIKMANDKESIVIKGDLTMTKSPGSLSVGTIYCAGDLSITGEDVTWNTSGDFQLVLNGDKEQYIYVANSEEEWEWDGEESYVFANLHIANAQNRDLKLKGHLDVGELTADSDTVTIISDGGQIDDAMLNCNLKITGNVITNGTLDLNGKNIDITGDLYQHSGKISMNDGSLNISGNYMILQNESAAIHTVSSGILNMTHDKDQVTVGGNFITMTNQNHSELLTAGTLEIKGDFYQYDDGTTYAFPASGTHIVILSGNEKQTVTFESYDDSHFNVLTLTQDEEQYVFSDDPCWNELSSEVPNPEFSTGDVNGDHSVDMKDVTLMRRKLADWDVTINEQYADVNGDSSFDMKDVTILRRYLADWDVTLA